MSEGGEERSSRSADKRDGRTGKRSRPLSIPHPGKSRCNNFDLREPCTARFVRTHLLLQILPSWSPSYEKPGGIVPVAGSTKSTRCVSPAPLCGSPAHCSSSRTGATVTFKLLSWASVPRGIRKAAPFHLTALFSHLEGLDHDIVGLVAHGNQRHQRAIGTESSSCLASSPCAPRRRRRTANPPPAGAPHRA